MPNKVKAGAGIMARGDWWNIKAAADDHAEIYIYGDIGDSWWGESVTASDLVKQLQEIDASHITVCINSFGGSVADGTAIYNQLRAHGAEITTRVDGVAMSIASVIAMAGDTVEMAETARLMIHAPWTYAGGNAKELRITADVLDGYADSLSAAYARKTGDREAALALLTDGEDHYYSAEEAKELGFIDSIIEPEFKAAASARAFDLSRFAQSKTQPKPAAAAAEQPKGNQPMTDKVKKPAAKPEAAKTTDNVENQAQLDAAKKAGAKAEAQRRQDIADVYAPFAKHQGVGELLATCQADAECSAENAREKLLAKLGEAAEPVNGTTTFAGGANNAAADDMAQALLSRMGVEKADASNQYAACTLIEMCKSSLQASGTSISGLSPVGVAAKTLRTFASQGTGDFGVALAGSMHKLLVNAFDGAPSTYEQFCRIGTVSDFRAHERLSSGFIGSLDVKNEHGEYKQKAIPDAEKNDIQVVARGNIVTITEEVLVNDDIGFILQMLNTLGPAAKRTIDALVYDVLKANPVLSDGNALFSNEHGNIMAGSAVSAAALLAMSDKMALQTGPGGNEPLDLEASIAVANRANARTISSIIQSEYDPDEEAALRKPNDARDLLDSVVSSVRAADAYYLFANPNVAAALEVAFLNGQQTPELKQHEGYRSGGLSWRVSLPFGVSAIDHRGVVMNPGNASSGN